MAQHLNEQVNHPQPRPVSSRRAGTIQATTTQSDALASPHYTGHDAGLHGEDAPYLSQVRIRHPTSVPQQADDQDEDTGYDRRPPRSAIRYSREVPARSRQTRDVRVPAKETTRLPRRQAPRFSWLFWLGLALLVMLVGFFALSALGSWWQTQQDNWHYGRPRTAQYDAVVGHNGDSAAHPSHFIALNLNRQIIVIELPAGNPAKAITYLGPMLVGDGEDLLPVTLSFEDRNGDGKPDLSIHLGDQVLVLLNTGKQFVAPTQH
ncbi:MAG TPA: hypothetical protein VJ761_18190 [Ktedonobacteraceae bacterium]|nr:hypothetical protein [Ktedonobacteraceae bacterium]